LPVTVTAIPFAALADTNIPLAFIVLKLTVSPKIIPDNVAEFLFKVAEVPPS